MYSSKVGAGSGHVSRPEPADSPKIVSLRPSNIDGLLWLLSQEDQVDDSHEEIFVLSTRAAERGASSLQLNVYGELHRDIRCIAS